MLANVRATAKPINDVLRYENQHLMERYAVDHHVSVDTARARFFAFKQFMVVCASKPGAKVTSTEIDGIWHCFLLFTRDYRAFCEEYLGRFINHEPFHTPRPEAYDETRRFAEALFGELDHELWPRSAKSDCSSGCDD